MSNKGEQFQRATPVPRGLGVLKI